MRCAIDCALLALDLPWPAILSPWGLTLTGVGLAYLYGYSLCRAAADGGVEG